MAVLPGLQVGDVMSQGCFETWDGRRGEKSIYGIPPLGQLLYICSSVTLTQTTGSAKRFLWIFLSHLIKKYQDTETALAKAADDKNVQIFPAFFEK